MRAPSACRPRAGIAWSVRCCSTGVKGARGGGRVVGACVRERRGVTAVLRYLARYLCGGRDQARTRERVGNNSPRRASGTTLDPPGRALEPRAALGRRGLGTELGYGGRDYARVGLRAFLVLVPDPASPLWGYARWRHGVNLPGGGHGYTEGNAGHAAPMQWDPELGRPL